MSSLHARIGLAVAVLLSGAAAAQDTPWPTTGGDPGGGHFSAAQQVTRANVASLQPAWTFHAAPQATLPQDHTGSFETTPILFNHLLYLSTETNHIFAIDPETGAQRWSFDPHNDWHRHLGMVTSRGVASWQDTQPPAAGPCTQRIFFATLDGRLFALDAVNGKPCGDFGANGIVDLTQNVDYRAGDNYSLTSPPTVIGDVVVVGSSIDDNVRVDAERGDVRAFDARSGHLLWTWDPIPWAAHQKLRTGAANTWPTIAADPEHHLVFLPVGSASPDHYGALRPGDNRDANSIVALDSRTGKKIWSFQVVHHDLWDYDIPSEPLLFNFRGNTPAVAVTTKMGLVFVFNRLTGDPLYPIQERPVPASDVPSEQTWPTQPFPDLPPLAPLTIDTTHPLGATPADDAYCRNLLAHLRYDGIYTPPSLRGTALFPGDIGGVDWGAAALDPATGILYADTNRLPFIVKLQPRLPLSVAILPDLAAAIFALLACLALAFAWKLRRARGLIACSALLLAVFLAFRRLDAHLRRSPWIDTRGLLAYHFGRVYGNDAGAPYIVLHQFMLGPSGAPCSPQPWGTVSALNLNTGQPAWQSPLGTRIPGEHTGTISLGGPLVTAGGLVFTAASTDDPLLHAFDSATGHELWSAKLPAPATANPMSYTIHGRQYIVIASGTRHPLRSSSPDAVIAFALPATPASHP